nr:MAG TPA: hypothetical protein [Caudoviricetes sp.]
MQPFTHTLFTHPLSLLSRPFHVRLNGKPKFPSCQRTNQVEPCPILAIGCRSVRQQGR